MKGWWWFPAFPCSCLTHMHDTGKRHDAGAGVCVCGGGAGGRRRLRFVCTKPLSVAAAPSGPTVHSLSLRLRRFRTQHHALREATTATNATDPTVIAAMAPLASFPRSQKSWSVRLGHCYVFCNVHSFTHPHPHPHTRVTVLESLSSS